MNLFHVYMYMCMKKMYIFFLYYNCNCEYKKFCIIPIYLDKLPLLENILLYNHCLTDKFTMLFSL